MNDFQNDVPQAADGRGEDAVSGLEVSVRRGLAPRRRVEPRQAEPRGHRRARLGGRHLPLPRHARGHRQSSSGLSIFLTFKM